MYSLKDKRALITGGTSGIGLAVAENFIAAGADATISGRREDGPAIASGIGAKFLHCDVTDETSMKACLSAAAEPGNLDILVANAGVALDEHSIQELDSKSMRMIMATNFDSVFYTLKHSADFLNDGASVIATGSVSGSGLTHAGTGLYAASKAGVAYLCRTSAIELAAREIRVNTVCPGLIAGTGMMTDDNGSPEASFYSRLTALGRMGRLDEVVGIYNFLAGDGSTFITGQEIRVDGGLTAGFGNPLMDAASGNCTGR